MAVIKPITKLNVCPGLGYPTALKSKYKEGIRAKARAPKY